MILERTSDVLTGTTVWTLTILPTEFRTVQFLPGDSRLLDDCESEDATIADKLLALELIARRIEETQKEN